MLEKKFDERFSLIGDFDLFLRLSQICIFESIQEPLASYRLHGKNLSTINKSREIHELKIWLDENKLNLSNIDINNLQKNVNQRKFVNYKIDGNYLMCLKILLNFKSNILNIKNLVILFIPNIILKKILWWHQD